MGLHPETLAGRLLAHFDATRRDMPWRRTMDPYAIWVSEAMLQQTRVEAVIPYYNRWIARFPDVQSLADAEDETVLRAWEGLGYYSRARNLHAAARIIREKHNNRVPDTAASLRTLPGVGAYTAGAVSSIAYGRAEPAIDGNARRVFARLLDLEQPSIPALQQLAQAFIPADRPGDFNQAVMELGATICTPRPRCDECPLQGGCLAFANDTVAIRPGAAQKQPVPVFDVASIVLVSVEGTTLVTQRAKRGLLAGFWEFPPVISTASQLARNARSNAARLMAGAPPRGRRLDVIAHAFSHRIERYHPFVYAGVTTDIACDVTHRWVGREEMELLPMSVAQRKIARAAGIAI